MLFACAAEKQKSPLSDFTFDKGDFFIKRKNCQGGGFKKTIADEGEFFMMRWVWFVCAMRS